MRYFPVLDSQEFSMFMSILETKVLLGEVFRVEHSTSDYFYFSAGEFIPGEKHRDLKVEVNTFLWPTRVATIFNGGVDRDVYLSRGQKFELWKLIIKVWISSLSDALIPGVSYA